MYQGIYRFLFCTGYHHSPFHCFYQYCWQFQRYKTWVKIIKDLTESSSAHHYLFHDLNLFPCWEMGWAKSIQIESF